MLTKRYKGKILVASVITLKGIEQAISGLNYRNKNSLKYKLVNTVRQFYENERSVESIQGIDSDELVKLLWNTGDDPAEIKNRRKNLSGIKYSVNSNFKKLYKEKENPDGIIIGPVNIFVMCNEAKDNALKAFKNSIKGQEAVSLGQITDILNIVNEILPNPEAIADAESSEGIKKFNRLKNLIQGLSKKVGLGGSESADATSKAPMAIPGEKETTGGPDLAEVAGGYGDLEEIVEDEDEIVEEAELFEEVVPEEEIVPDESQEVKGTEDLDEEEVVEDLEDVETDDAIEEADVDEEIEYNDPEEVDDIQELDEETAIEEVQTTETDDTIEEDEVEIEEAEIEDDLEEVNVAQGAEEADLLADHLGGKYSDVGHEGGDKKRKARLLAEEFNNLLGASDRYYNQYILIPEGEYIVGSKQPKKDEKPEQTVHLLPFYMGKFQVTNALFGIFVEKTGYATTAEKIGYGTVYYGRLQKTVDEKNGLERFVWNATIMSKTVKGACWYQPLGHGSAIHNKRNHPVVQVSSEDAMAFAAWTGKSLPAEDEWEAASRTAKGYVYPWGDEWKKEPCNIEESYVGDTTPVDKYIEFANDLGIVDTMGNVLEWTLEKSEPPSFIKDRSKYFVVKGGSWISGNELRLFNRFTLKPGSQSNILGFRCVAY